MVLNRLTPSGMRMCCCVWSYKPARKSRISPVLQLLFAKLTLCFKYFSMLYSDVRHASKEANYNFDVYNHADDVESELFVKLGKKLTVISVVSVQLYQTACNFHIISFFSPQCVLICSQSNFPHHLTSGFMQIDGQSLLLEQVEWVWAESQRRTCVVTDTVGLEKNINMTFIEIASGNLI